MTRAFSSPRPSWKGDKHWAPDLQIWRYMDFAKFVAILETRALHFARADTLGDPFEGASGIVERELYWDGFYRDFFRQALATAPEPTLPPPDAVLDHEADRLLKEFKQLGELDRLRHFVNCWHAGTAESEALWRLYCPPPSPGIAIRTTVGALEKSLESNANI